MNKLAILAISAAVTASVLAVPLASQDIVVVPQSHANFVAQVSKDLDRQLARIHFDPREDATGIAKVRFQASPDGRATQVEIYQRSGSGQLDSAARRAVRGLTNLTPLPYGSEDGQVIQANIVVAGSRQEMQRLTSRLSREEAARIARSPQERAVLALTLAPRPVS